jgi:apolipoprotein D and lipocalin family protein
MWSSNEPMNARQRLSMLIPLAALSACSASTPPLQTVERVDLSRFMGDWYVVANIPTFLEKDAYNAIESYELVAEKKVATTFSFNQGGFDGPLRTFKPTGFVSDHPSNAIWGMQFIWPIKADYRIIYLTEDYSQTVIARNRRDYVWIMAREPVISDEDYQVIAKLIAEQGYDISKIRPVPHRRTPTAEDQP